MVHHYAQQSSEAPYMKLSTKGRYAVTAMMDLAIHDRIGPVTLSDISNCQGISLSYLEQLFAKLRKAGLVEGVRGPGGGYRLAKRADQISIANIIMAVDESVDVTRCKGHKDCQQGERCLTHELWDDLSQQLHEFLDGITLAQFANRPEVQKVARRQDERRARHHFIFGHDAA
jgi:Rrf2 family iron-sulfur cluster assembly transcriptional regulator